MAKPAKFKYKPGQSVKFRFYDGSIHEGIIELAHYRNSEVDYLPTEYNQPMYTCHVPDTSGNYSRGYMIYTITEGMVKDKTKSEIKIVSLQSGRNVDAMMETNELADAIAKQNAFVSGKVSN